MALRLRRGTDAQRLLITPLEGELIYTTDTQEIYVGDGVTAGGIRVTGIVPENIEDLQNVSSTVPGDNDVLIWDALTSQWTPIPLDTIAPGSTLESLADVDLTLGSFVNGAALTYNEGEASWQPTVLSINTLSDVDLSIGTFVNGSVLTYNQGLGVWQPSSLEFAVPQLLDRDLQGSVFGDDSTVLVDAINNQIVARNLLGDKTFFQDDGTRLNLELNSSNLPDLNRTFVEFNISGTDVDGNSLLASRWFSGSFGTFFTNDPNGVGLAYPESQTIALTNAGITYGSYTATAALDIRGNAIITGGLTADLTGSVFGDDSTVLVDAVNNQIVARNLLGDKTFFQDDGTRLNLELNSSNLPDLNRTFVEFNISGTDVDGNSLLASRWFSGSFGTFFTNDPNGVGLTYPESQTIALTNSGITYGSYTATAALDIRGNAIITGGLTADVTGSLFADDSTILIDAVNNQIVARNLLGDKTFVQDDGTRLNLELSSTNLPDLNRTFVEFNISGTDVDGNELLASRWFSGSFGTFFTNDPNGVGLTYPEAETIALTNSGITYGSYTATAALDIRGDAIITGGLTADVTGSLFSDSSTILIDATDSRLMIENLNVTGVTTNTPVDTGSVDSWLEVTINGATKYIPLYA